MTPKLIVGLQVYNEAARFLPEWIKDVESYADGFVALDDASTDATPTLLSKSPKCLNLERSPNNLFHTNELLLRKRLWEMLKTAAKPLFTQGHVVWFLLLDADEFMEDKFKRDRVALMQDPKWSYYGLQFIHFWRSRTHYRIDKLWKPSHGPRMVRYDPTHQDKWREAPLHCGSLPTSLWNQKGKPGRNVDYIIKHFGYALSPEEKYDRYFKLDPTGKYAPKLHYESMKDSNPTLVLWKERI